jgi:hypothetical protein
MQKFYSNLTKTKKILFIVVTTILSIPIGAILGLIIGLISITFIPMCCIGDGCHSCFEFNGMIGYEATGSIGLLLGVFIIPISYIGLIIYLELKS